MYRRYPYTNFHDINLDWIIEKVQDLDNKVNNQIEDIINNYVNTHMSKFMMKAMYDEANTAIKFIGTVGGNSDE